MTIGERLNDLRIKDKKTLKELSEIFGVSLNTIYRWEHNFTVPRKSSLMKIAAYYDVPIEWLCNGEATDEYFEAFSIRPEGNTENQLIKMYRELSEYSKYKILGYIERIYVEEINKAAT